MARERERRRVGARIAALREAKGLTRTQLAAAIGASERTIARIETGGELSFERADCIAQVLGVTLDELRAA